jgi:hypothetical protein
MSPLKLIRAAKPRAKLVNEGQTRSVVGSDNDLIARAMSLLIGIVGHPGNITPDQARDVIEYFDRSSGNG